MNINPRLLLTRDKAAKLVPDLVTYVELKPGDITWATVFEKLNALQIAVKVGDPVVVAVRNYAEPTNTIYVRALVSSVTRDWRNEDGPVVRVKAGRYSWRVDGNDPFQPVKGSN